MNPFVQAILNLFAEIWNWVLDIWDTGNHWARWAIAIFILWPIVVVLAALLPSAAARIIVPIIALLPVIAIAFLLIAVIDPLVIGAIAVFQGGRRALRFVGAVIGVELAFGLYLAILPVGNWRGLVPILLLTAIALPLLHLVPGVWGRWMRRFAIIVLVFVTFLSFFPNIAPALAERWWARETEVGQTIRTKGVGVILPAFPKDAGQYPICADTEAGLDVTLAAREHQLQLHPDCWSGWVSMPTAPYTFRIKNRKPMEMRFWNGRRLLAQPEDKIWLGDIGSSNFRLRGEEVVTIIVEPR